MSTPQITIKCGRCKVPVEGPADPNDDDVFSCPLCGNSDTLKNIMSEAGKSAADKAAQHLGDRFAAALKGSKGWSIQKGSPRQQKSRRFIIEMKL